MTRTPLVLVGGFLGAGKTTLIVAAARVLGERGMRCAAILNDQGEDLVDTRLAGRSGVMAEQVTGGCFCCRFSELIEAAERLEQYKPDVIFAEAVGSCTDVVATVLRPLEREYGERFRVAPLTVLVEAGRQHTDADAEFLIQHQVAEADLVVTSKADRVWTGEGRRVSARTGDGVVEWLDEVLWGGLAAGEKRIEVDYGRYAEAEASLAWMNCRAVMRPRVPLSPAMVVGPLMERLDVAVAAAGARVAHLKVLDECASGYVKASICGNALEPEVEGALDASPEAQHELLVNLRAAGDPESLRGAVERAVEEAGAVEWRSLQCFRPAAPVPERARAS